MNLALETPSRLWRRIQDGERGEHPSLPSLPAFDESGEPRSEDTDSIDLDLSNGPSIDPVHSTPAAYSSHSVSTVRQPLSAASTARFANSIASRSSKSASMSASRGSTARPQTILPPDSTFDISSIPSLPHAPYDSDIRSSDQDTASLGDPQLRLEAASVDDLDLSDVLRSVNRPSSPPLPDPEPTPRKKYDYSVSLRSEPKPSPYDKLRNVSFRRPLSRNTRTPSLTRTNTPSDSSSSTHSTPRSSTSLQQSHSPDVSPINALAAPLPRSVAASPMLPSRPVSASPMPARLVPLPPSTRNSPLTTTHSPRTTHIVSEDSTTIDDYSRELPTLPPPDLSLGSDLDIEGLNSIEERTVERELALPSEQSASQPDNTADTTDGPSQGQRSPIALSSARSSPSPSAMLTPTPAYTRRPRFQALSIPKSSMTPSEPPPAPDETQDEQALWNTEQPDMAATPNARKRSFLLSVINSTARPRLRTQPRNSMVPATPGVNLQAALAGVTPGPGTALRRRMSHPLAQEWTARPDSRSGSESPGGYDGAADKVSFLSTTSSQDLVIHARANASFDPSVGLGDRGHGVDRFNSSKLNNYLHGLNKKLQEENETLVAQLRAYEKKAGGSGTSGYDEPVRNPRAGRRASAGRRISTGPAIGLNDVAEGWEEEKAELEEVISELTEQLGKVSAEKEDTEKILAEEKTERARDREKWRDRMGEVEKGVQDIVDDIYQKLRASEDRAQTAEKEKVQVIKELEKRLAEVTVERDVLSERTKSAEGVLEKSQDLGGVVNAANERVSNVLADLKNANLQIKDLEGEAINAEERMDALEQELREEKKLVTELEQELQLKSEELEGTLKRIDTLQTDLRATRGELQTERVTISQMERAGEAAVDRIESLEELIGSTQERLAALTEVLDQEREKASQLEAEVDRANDLAGEMEEALDDAEDKMRSNEQEIAALKTKVASLERELDRSRTHESSQRSPEDDADIATLETELEDAHREIARLNTLVSQSPARKAVEKAKDAKIEMLEQERDDLVERLKNLKNSTFGTPGRSFGVNGISPMHRRILDLSLRGPKTPGGPLKELSWLQTPMKDADPVALLSHIEQLQSDLDRANDSIDDKLDRLESAGAGVVSLTNQLQDARDKVISLENEVARLGRREERKDQRLEKLHCKKCGVKVDTRHLQQQRSSGDDSSCVEVEDTAGSSMAPSSSSDKLRANLHAVNTQLATMKQQWESEKHKLLGENATLKDATKRLNAEVRQAKDDMKRYSETERGKASMQAELDKAKRMVAELEGQLKAERSRLRGFATEQTQAERQKDEVALQLRRTESDMAEIREELLRIKNENHELEAELRVNSTAEQKTRLLEAKVIENTETIEQLRQERSVLVSDYKDLQKQFGDVVKRLSKVREQHAASQTSHEQRRHDLDLQLLEIEDLRKLLSQQADVLQLAEEQKERVTSEKTDMSRTVATLESDLRRVKRDAEAFGRDLKQLRSQKERLEETKKEEVAKAERAQKQAQTQIRLLKEEAKEEREKTKTLQDLWSRHVCATDSTQGQTSEAQHKAECKGLILQINFVKAKWAREFNLRGSLVFQKNYLLDLLAKREKSAEMIVAAISKIGFPNTPPRLPPTPRIKRTLRNVTFSIIFILRAQRAGQAWQAERAKKVGLPEALAEVRRRREETAKPKDKGKQRATS